MGDNLYYHEGTERAATVYYCEWRGADHRDLSPDLTTHPKWAIRIRADQHVFLIDLVQWAVAGSFTPDPPLAVGDSFVVIEDAREVKVFFRDELVLGAQLG